LQEKPFIPVSTATKNKLNNFQFLGLSNDGDNTKAVINLVSDDEKENEGAKKEQVDELPREDLENCPPELPKLPELGLPRDVPTTPAGRLALTDLIGMGDIRREVQTISPDERIEWNHDKDMIPGSESAFGAIRRARKRARSSSPTGSPSAQASPRFSAKFESMNPQVDPGSELWGRYSLNGSNAPTPQGPSIPALAHLMHTSSPQPSKEGGTPRSASGFRRANSCGNQFPKRRRVGGCEGDDVFTESATIGPSKLAVLIERVQEGLTQPRKPPTSPASSSSPQNPLDRPLDDVEEVKYVVHDHPQELEAAPELSLPRTNAVTSKIEPVIPPQAPKVQRSDSSDYGDFEDDELDETLLEVLEEGAAPTPQVPPNPPPQPFPQTLDRYRPPLQMETSESFESGTLKADSDEFGDSDDELFTADLENIASQFDTKTHGRGKTTSIGGAGASGQRARLARAKSESEDEFGDGGLNDLDFETAEATATQSIQQTAGCLLPVRTRYS